MPATETAPAPETAEPKAATAPAGKVTPEGDNPALEYPLLLHVVVVRDAAAALKWYEGALDAETAFRHDDSDGRIMHAVLKTTYGLIVGVEDHYPKMHMVRPVADGEVKGEEGAAAKGCSYVYVTIPKGKGSADAAIERMREAGATVIMEPEDKFYGQRLGQVVDPYGVAWAFAHKIEAKEKDPKPAPPAADGDAEKKDE